ncbi:protein phosphatase [Streptomyces sp. TRM 70351]|uniref:protein phosphatase n=1 Tax=Streptomyces sp. TRM 70351 TaxID=3116552 RepID=UPI002E7B211F|nr:protein phosphatase [Streptomyces sp. TRM 70351]MEE1930958.1 protein phosphatase [Streptomyces sp. TRM 70351]
MPWFTGDLEQLERDAAALRGDAGAVRGTGAGVHSTFQGLSAFYSAPEAEQLFGTTEPVAARADAFAGDLEKVGSALDTFAVTVRPVVERLERLKGEAASFRALVRGDEEWTYDEGKISRNRELTEQISAAVAEFWEAERTAANEITALVGGTRWVADDGSGAGDVYGLDAGDLREAGRTPWGEAVEEDHHWYEVGHWVKSYVWDGFIVDGIWGTLEGLGGLVGFGGWETFRDSWKGLGQLTTGLVVLAVPTGVVTHRFLPEGAVKDWVDQSMNTTREVGKSLVAWDEWEKDPVRAAGLVSFNVVTTVATLGVGTAVKGASGAGNAAKVAGAAARAGQLVDPMTYLGRGAGAAFRGLPEIGDVTAGLKNLTTVRAAQLPDGTLRLPDGTVLAPDAPLPDLPPGSTAVELPANGGPLPEGTVKFDDDTFLTPDGSVVDAHALPRSPAAEAKAEPTANDHPSRETSAGPLADGASTASRVTGAGDTSLSAARPDASTSLTAQYDEVSPGVREAAGTPSGRDIGPASGSPDVEASEPRNDTGHGTPENGDYPDGALRAEALEESPAHAGPAPAGAEQSGGWGGAGWVDEPSESAGAAYEAIRSTPNRLDLPQIAKETGIKESVLREVKSHLFRSRHEIAIGPGEVKKGLFTPRDDIAAQWEAAKRGDLDEGVLMQFRSLMAHEYVESQLMKSGMPYVSSDPAVWNTRGGYREFPDDLRYAGAHDVAPNDKTMGWKHWERRLGMHPPPFGIASDLSNLDDVVRHVKRELKRKGIDVT